VSSRPRLHRHRIALLIALLAVALWGHCRGSSYRNFFRHDPRQAHDYALDRRDGQTFEVRLTRNGFEWPEEAPQAGVTAFLELHVKTRVLLPSLDPSIEFRSGDRSFSQSFAPRSTGRRYLNVSPAAGPGRVDMVGRQIGWRTESTRLVVFPNRPIDESTRVLVVAPHPDDAEIAAFGLYATTLADVVTVTAGDYGGKNYGGLFPETGEHYRIKGLIRTWDSLTVPFIGHVPINRARNLGYFDGTLRTLHERRPRKVPAILTELQEPGLFRRVNTEPQLATRPFESSWPALVEDLRREVDWVGPELIAAPNPLLDSHADHQYTTVALIEALEERGWDGALLLYTNHPTRAEPYPLGPNTALESLPPWFGDELPFLTVLSYPVDETTRRLNYLALEAMHDLRPFEHRVTTPFLERTRDLAAEAVWRALGRHDKLPGYLYDYLRRGPRPNEIYLVLDLEQAVRLKERFLEIEAVHRR